MTEDNSKITETVSQNHSGPGDNVNKKIVYNAISSSAIQDPVKEILTCLRHRTPKIASDKLKTLSATTQLDAQAKAILDVVSVLVKIASDGDITHGYSIVESCLQNQSDPFYVDIANSTKLRLDIKNERIDEAKKLYQSLESSGQYSQEVFYEFIAQASELESILDNNVHELTEVTLCGLTRGFLRCKNHEKAVSCSDSLLLKYPCFNSKIVSLIARCHESNDKLSANHYWLTKSSDKKQILLLVDECIDLLEECNSPDDTRAVSLSIGFLQFLTANYSPLVDACWKHLNIIQNLDQKMANFLRGLRDRKNDELKGLPYEIEKANTDFSYKKALIERLENSPELSSEDLVLFGNVADSTVIRKWVANGGSVLSKDKLEKQFHQIELLCYANDGSHEASESLKKTADLFICNNKSALSTINLIRLYDLTNMLLDVGLNSQVCALLQPIILTEDIWLSPIVKNYIIALLKCQQLTTLNGVLSEIDQTDWCEFLWQIKAGQLEFQNEIDDAIKAIEKALEQSPMSLAVWNNLIHLLKRNDTEQRQYKEYLERVPTDVLANQNTQSLQLLFELASNGYDETTDITLINWFLDDPVNSAKSIVDFHVKLFTYIEKYESSRTVLYSPKFCIAGFRYTLDGKDTTKLVVNGTTSKHFSIIQEASPLAQRLLNMTLHETVQYNGSDLTLTEKLPPCIAIFRLSLQIRLENNDGSDFFHQFSLPENPEEMISSLKKKMVALSSNDKKEEFYKNPAYPLFLKGHMLGNGCPVQSALNQLISKQSIKSPLPNIGVEVPERLCLDIYSIAYLGLTGLIHGLENTQTKIFITIETQFYLKQFLENVNRDDFMQMGVNEEGELWRIQADEIKKETAQIQSAINLILEIADIESPKLADMPPEILLIQKAVDLSVFSSLKLSVVNDTPWLCIDEAFALLAHKSNYPVVNANNFFTVLSNSLSIKKKLPSLYLHVTAGIPCPITFNDLIEMSKVDDDLAHYFLSKILKMYPNAYANSDIAVQHLHKIILLSLIKGYLAGSFPNGLSPKNRLNNGHTERLFTTCCYLTIQIQDGEWAEYKLAKLLHAIFIASEGNSQIYSLVRQLGTRFISGHFLSFDTINKYIRELLNEDRAA